MRTLNRYLAVLAIYVVFRIVLGALSGDYSDSTNTDNPFDYARITDLNYRAVVVDDQPGDNGKIIVTERITYDIHAASKNNLFWELWRDLPEQSVYDADVSYRVNSVKQVFDDRPPIVYAQSSKLYWDDSDYIDTAAGYGPHKWYYSKGPYDEDRRQYECVLFYVDGLYREKVTFEIEYEMTNASLRYNDCSELYIALFSGPTTKHLNSFQGEFLIPLDKMPQPGNYTAYTYGTNAYDFPFSESSTVNPGYYTFSFSLDKSQLKFKPDNEYIEFALLAFGEDRHSFTQYASKGTFNSFNMLERSLDAQAEYEALPAKYRTEKIILLVLFTAAVLLIHCYISWLDKKIKKSHTFYTPSTEYEYYRDIPSDLDPEFAASLVFCKDSRFKQPKSGYSALMLSLVQKGYIELSKIEEESDWEPNNVRIVVKQGPEQEEVQKTYQVTPDLKPLSLAEEQYFNLILRHSKGFSISLLNFQHLISSDYEYTNSFLTKIKNSIVTIGVTLGYFSNPEYKKEQKNLFNRAILFAILGFAALIAGNLMIYPTRLDLAFGAFFILGLGSIAASLRLNAMSKKYVLLTQFGENEYAKWRGLYNFLNSATLLNERTVIELALWEQYMIYATAFGISEKVVNALNVRCTEVEASPVLRNPYYRTSSFRHYGHSFRTATRSASFTASSGGFSGYGGGGRGGGGGGGGH